MRELQLKDMESLQGGDFVTGMCWGVGGAAAITTIGANAAYLGLAAANFWNPAGWVMGAFAVASLACIGYGISQS
jgi:hypothetical protein